MTKEEAARILDPATTVEALAEIEYYAGFSGQIAKIQACNVACEIAAAVLRESAAKDAKVLTNGDRFRALPDEELVEKLFQAYRAAADWQGFSDLSMHWCDGKSGCIDVDGNIECDEERHKACILRWLKSEVPHGATDH